MTLKIIVLNGFPRSGKDEFIRIAKTEYYCDEISSIDKVKEIATTMGWDGKKTINNRQMLSELKKFYIDWFDGPFTDIKNKIQSTDAEWLFVCIREIDEIIKLRDYCREKSLLFYSIIIKRNLSEKNHISSSDKYVNNFNYDYYIDNNSTLIEFNKKTLFFIKCHK